MEWINLTPHTIVLQAPNGTRMEVPPAGTEARVTQVDVEPCCIEGTELPVVPFPKYGDVEGLPPPRTGAAFLVSLLTLERCVKRADVFAPATGPRDGAIREAGRVVAVTRLVAAPGTGPR